VSEPLLYEVEEGIARLTLNRPEKRNALNTELIRRLREGLLAAEGDPSVRVVTIRGAGKDFCAGGDLAELAGLAGSGIRENLADVEELAALFLAIRRLSRPVVALVRGRALAGGAGLATACDLVLAGEEALFGYPEVHIGFVPAMVASLLRRNVSEKRAFELITLGESFGAVEAERWGVVNRVFPESIFDEQSANVVRSLAERSASAVTLAKRLLYQQDSLDFEGAIGVGVSINALARTTEDTRKGVRDFLETRGAGGRG